MKGEFRRLDEEYVRKAYIDAYSKLADAIEKADLSEMSISQLFGIQEDDSSHIIRLVGEIIDKSKGTATPDFIYRTVMDKLTNQYKNKYKPTKELKAYVLAVSIRMYYFYNGFIHGEITIVFKGKQDKPSLFTESI